MIKEKKVKVPKNNKMLDNNFLLLQHNLIRINNFIFDQRFCLGQGTTGKVFLGYNDLTQEYVGIKQINLIEISKNLIRHQMLLREIEISKQIEHQNLLKTFEILQSDKFLYIISEYCSEGDLSKRIAEQGPLGEEQSLQYFFQIVEGFKELQKKHIIHRDLKPANLLLSQNQIKIADFGFSRYIQESNCEALRSKVGSPFYMSPQVLCNLPYTDKVDIWSLGIIFYEMLFGHPPWVNANIFNEIQLVDYIYKNSIQQLLKQEKECQSLSSLNKKLLLNCLQIDESNRFSWNDLFNIQEKMEKLQNSYQISMQYQQMKVEEFCVFYQQLLQKRAFISFLFFLCQQKLQIKNILKDEYMAEAFFLYLSYFNCFTAWQFLSQLENHLQRNNFEKKHKLLIAQLQDLVNEEQQEYHQFYEENLQHLKKLDLLIEIYAFFPSIKEDNEKLISNIKKLGKFQFDSSPIMPNQQLQILTSFAEKISKQIEIYILKKQKIIAAKPFKEQEYIENINLCNLFLFFLERVLISLHNQRDFDFNNYQQIFETQIVINEQNLQAQCESILAKIQIIKNYF